MASSYIDLAGELPDIEHRQLHTQALLLRHASHPCSPTDLLKSQIVDLLEDTQACGLDQSHALCICMEAVRHLKSTQFTLGWRWEGLGIALSYESALIAGPSGFLTQDILLELGDLSDSTLIQAMEEQGPQTTLEQEEGLPDPERLVLAAAIVVLRCYVQALGGTLNARYFVEARATLVAASTSDGGLYGNKAA